MAYKETCVQCHSRNFYVTPENGKGYCFSCGYFTQTGECRPPQRSLHIPAIRALYTELAAYYHSCLDTTHRDYLHSRGINDALISTAQIGFVPNSPHILYQDMLAKDAGLVRPDGSIHLQNRIVFPYHTTALTAKTPLRDHGSVTDIRGRAVLPDELKYLSPKHSGFYRGADYPYCYSALRENRVVITEGEIKALLSNHVGVPCVALPGIVSMRPMLRQGEKHIFIVCFDAPYTPHTIRAIYRLGQRFEGLLVATLPTFGASKMDIDTLILEHGAGVYLKAISRAIPFETWKALIRV